MKTLLFVKVEKIKGAVCFFAPNGRKIAYIEREKKSKDYPYYGYFEEWKDTDKFYGEYEDVYKWVTNSISEFFGKFGITAYFIQCA